MHPLAVEVTWCKRSWSREVWLAALKKAQPSLPVIAPVALASSQPSIALGKSVEPAGPSADRRRQ
jgi:hypothetical protein